MNNPAIFFTAPGVAELRDTDMPTPAADRIVVRSEYSAVSAGTEYACLMGLPNTASANGSYPIRLGYSLVGYVEAIGSSVKGFKVGDRVLVYHGTHTKYNCVGADQLTKVEDSAIDSREAAFVIIATMGLGGVRKLELELGESAMVMGLGLLGMFALRQLALSGADPLIAVDFDAARREKAIEMGADYALDPSAPDFVEQVKKLTGGKGVKATVEVTGSSAAMVQALDCAAWMGRIALLGCTRVSDCSVDYYSQVHKPGIKLIGAHNFIRPKHESYPHHWTHHDDCRALLSLISRGKLRVLPIISEIHAPEDAPEVYARLARRELPLGVLFKWE